MALYKNLTKDSAIRSVEFTPVADGNFTFVSVDKPENKERIKQWLTSDMGQTLIAETSVNGHPMLVTRGDKSRDDIMKALQERGDKLKLKVAQKPFNFWALRGGMSVVGHTLGIISAFIQVKKDADGKYTRKGVPYDTLAFSVLNQVANVTNIVYGGQQTDDSNRLNFLKDQLNDDLGPHISRRSKLIDPEEQRSDLRKGPQPAQTMMQKANQFMKENSVRLGEIGFRWAGSVFLAFPVNNFKAGWAKLIKGELKEGYKAFRNSDHIMHMAGMGYLTGKTLALFSKVPDPYSDKPHTALDTFREKYLFKNAGLIEATSGYTTMVRRWNGVIGVKGKEGNFKVMEDWPQRIGGFLFGSGYIVRYFAKFGTKNLDMDEVYAHATDTLAKTKPEQMPQLMAETSAALKENLKDKPVEFGEIFTKMMTDLYRYHHMTLEPDSDKPLSTSYKEVKADRAAARAANDSSPAKLQAISPAADDGVFASAKKKIGGGLDDVSLPDAKARLRPKRPAAKDAIASRAPLERVAAPADKHADVARSAKETATLSV